MYYFVRNGIYYIGYTEGNKDRRISTKSRSLEEARKFVENNFRITPQQKMGQDTITLKKFSDEYVKYIASSHTSSYLKSVKLSFRKFIEHIRDKPIDAISLKEIDNFISTVYKRAPHSSNLYYRSLKAAFSKAVLWDYIEENPFAKVKPIKTPSKIPVFLSVKDLQQIIKFEADPNLRDLYKFAFYTGMRLGEITNLKLDSIDLKNKMIIVRNHSSFMIKNKTERVIPIHIKVIKIIKKLSQHTKSDYLFNSSKGVKYLDDYVSKHFKKCVRKADMDDNIKFHNLRHSFASLLVQKGVSLYVVKELLGHKTIRTTQIYAHLQSKQLYEAINKLED